MNANQVGRIERLPLRDVWKHEAHHLTVWLEENLDLLADALGMSLQSIEREKRVGDYIVDLVAQDGRGDLVVIENQLERTDHDHLGKLITYVAMIDAKRAIWIVPEPRAEHLKAVQWLNEAGMAEFYLLKLEAIKIGDSLPAALFTLITGPSDAISAGGQIKRDQANTNTKWGDFWKAFVEAGQRVSPLFKSVQPKDAGEIYSTLGYIRGFWIKQTFNRNVGRVEFYMDDTSKGKEFTTGLIHSLERRKDAIEQAFGGPLTWHELPQQRVSRISKTVDATVDFEAPSSWQPCIDQMIDVTIRLDKAFRPHLATAVAEAEEEVRRLAIEEDASEHESREGERNQKRRVALSGLTADLEAEGLYDEQEGASLGAGR
jgi:hypothetical protein